MRSMILYGPYKCRRSIKGQQAKSVAAARISQGQRPPDIGPGVRTGLARLNFPASVSLTYAAETHRPDLYAGVTDLRR